MHKVTQFVAILRHIIQQLQYLLFLLRGSEYCVRYAQCINNNTKNKHITPSELSYNLIFILAIHRRKRQNQHPYHMDGVLYNAGITYPLRAHWFHPLFSGGVRVVHPFSFLCFVVFFVFVFVLCRVCSVLPVYLGCSFSIAPSVFFGVYLNMHEHPSSWFVTGIQIIK